jgi:hypothetical protein
MSKFAMSKFSKRTAVLGIMSTLALGTIAAAPAYAKGGGVTTKGHCSMASQSKIKLSHDDNVIQTEFEVDSNQVGQVWHVVLRDNGTRVLRTTKTTTAPSGSFTVHRRIPNLAGPDNIVAKATNATTGETCIVRASI